MKHIFSTKVILIAFILIILLVVNSIPATADSLHLASQREVTQLQEKAPTASIFPLNGGMVNPIKYIEITVKDDTTVDLNRTEFSIDKDGSDITNTLKCKKEGHGTAKGTITCCNNDGLDVGEYAVVVTPVDLEDNIGDIITSVFKVPTCKPALRISPSNILYAGERQMFTATTTCDDETIPGIYSWTAGGGTLDTTSGDKIFFVCSSINCSLTATDILNGRISTILSSIIIPPAVVVSPDPMYRSRWIMIPVLVTVAACGTSFDSSTVITYDPPISILPMPPLVVSGENIWQLIFVMPSWLTGIWDESEIFTLTVTWEAGVISDDVTIRMLPFPLDEQKILK